MHSVFGAAGSLTDTPGTWSVDTAQTAGLRGTAGADGIVISRSQSAIWFAPSYITMPPQSLWNYRQVSWTMSGYARRRICMYADNALNSA